MNKYKFDQVMELDGQKLTKAYIKTLSKEQREALVEPIFQMIRRDLPDFPLPDDESKIEKEWKRIQEFKPDISTNEIYNNSSVGTYISKFFCKDFYSSKGEKDKYTMQEVFNNDEMMRKLVWNRLGIGWFEEENGSETFNLSPKMIIQGMRSMRYISHLTTFKPTVAKYLTLKYSQPGDIIYDYSAGWGARLLSAAACVRQYIGIDPLTTPDLQRMVDYLKLPGITLLQMGSEDYTNYENTVDFSYSSPPYFNQERYSEDNSQCYNQGEYYFYNVYWKKTLENVKYMLKPDKWFGLNVINYPKMLDMAKEAFGEHVEVVQLKTVRSHLNKAQGQEAVKFEPIWMFKNVK